MDQNRRDFLKSTALVTGAAMITNNPYKALAENIPANFHTGKMNLTYRPYTLELKHVFTIATNSRTTTPIVLTELNSMVLLAMVKRLCRHILARHMKAY